MTNSTDEQLMADYQSGNQEAIKVIFERYKSRVLNFCLRMLQNRAEAEDATGDVFLALFSGKYSYDPKAKFSTWLFTVARNNCIDRIRKHKKTVSMWFSPKNTSGEEERQVSDTNPSSPDQLIKNETAECVKNAINKLPFEQREAIILREYHDFNYKHIAEILGCSLEKVKILIFRGREQLRNELTSFIKEDHHNG